MQASGVNAPSSLTSRLSLRVSSYINTSSIFSSPSLLFPGRGGERRGQNGEAQAPVKWLYRGETRAGRGPRLKAEWQAAETIKIESLSLAARALLIQAGAQAALIHTHPHILTHLVSPVVLELTCSDMDVDMCVFIYTYKQLFFSVSVCLSRVYSTFQTHQSLPGKEK